MSQERIDWHGLTRRWTIMGALVCVASWTLMAASDARAASPAEAFVQSNVERSYAILDDRTLSGPERQRRFRDLLPTSWMSGVSPSLRLAPMLTLQIKQALKRSSAPLRIS